MNVLIISLFGFSESGRSYKISTITFKDDTVTAISSDFNHGKKEYYEASECSSTIGPIRFHVPAYKRNLSVKRIISHAFFALSLRRYLNRLTERPDLIYCAMPTSTAAYVAGTYCKKHDIPFMIDVIDLWPDSLIPIVPFKRLIDLCVSPWRYITKKAYKMADYISGESKRYAEIAHKVNQKVPFSYTYLGVDSEKTENLLHSSQIFLEKPEDEIWIGYGGSLGQSYDFEVILKGLSYLGQHDVKYKMWFIGDGEKVDYIRKYAEDNDLNVEITGRLEYKDLLKYLFYCDIAINSFKPGTLVVHSYKFNDYVAIGCYILNNLPGETSEMIEEYKIGKNFDSTTFDKILIETVKNWNNLKVTIKDHFDRLKKEKLESSVIYSKLRTDISEKLYRKFNLK